MPAECRYTLQNPICDSTSTWNAFNCCWQVSTPTSSSNRKKSKCKIFHLNRHPVSRQKSRSWILLFILQVNPCLRCGCPFSIRNPVNSLTSLSTPPKAAAECVLPKKKNRLSSSILILVFKMDSYHNKVLRLTDFCSQTDPVILKTSHTENGQMRYREMGAFCKGRRKAFKDDHAIWNSRNIWLFMKKIVMNCGGALTKRIILFMYPPPSSPIEKWNVRCA